MNKYLKQTIKHFSINLIVAQCERLIYWLKENVEPQNLTKYPGS